MAIAMPSAGAVSLAIDPELPRDAYTAIGFPAFGQRALRADIVEKLHARLAADFDTPGDDARLAELASLAGTRREQLPSVLAAFAE
jgi:ATP-dependent RNA helicase SUPV3L1/SUV3